LDQRALELGKPAQDGEHERPVRGRGIGPAILDRAEASARLPAATAGHSAASETIEATRKA
jgi:hypothetical protein